MEGKAWGSRVREGGGTQARGNVGVLKRKAQVRHVVESRTISRASAELTVQYRVFILQYVAVGLIIEAVGLPFTLER